MGAVGDGESIESAVIAYLKTLKTKGVSKAQGGDLYGTLLRGIPEISKKERLVIVPDGRLHLLPFDPLVDGSRRYLVSSHTITYSPSPTSVYLTNSAPQKPPSPPL